MDKWTLLISIIGAAAWIPPLLTFISNFIKKPIVTVIPASHVEIGFTELGPIINMKVALTADNEDVLVDLIEFVVHHDSGAQHRFRWHEVSEVKGQMVVSGRPNEGVTQYLETEAIAIKILEDNLKDIYLRNRMQEHTSGYRKYVDEFNKERRRLINSNQYFGEQFYAAKAAQDFQAFLQSQMMWKKGKYTLAFHVRTKKNAKIVSPKMSFSLYEDDVILMQSNCDNMPKLVKNYCVADFQTSENLIPLEWQWLDKETSAE